MSAAALKTVATGQQTAQEAKNPYLVFKDQLERTKPQLLGLMGGSKANVEKLCSVIERAVLDNMELLNADRRSLVASCLKAAQDGLMPDGREAVLNIYSTKVKRNGRDEWIKAVQYLPMVAGYIKGLYDHPDVAMVDAAAVFANDRFRFIRGDDPRLEHEPTMEDDSGPVICAYLVVKLKSGEIKREVMPRRDIEKVKAVSKAQGENSPWAKWYDQQAIKSVIKRGAKQLPRSNKFEQIDRHDNEAVGFTGTPDNVAAAVMGAAHGPALEHQPGEILEQTLGSFEQAAEAEHAHQHAGEGNQAQEQQAQQAQSEVSDAAPKVTYAQLATRLAKCKDRDTAALIVDEGRGLPDEQRQELSGLFTAKFPE